MKRLKVGVLSLVWHLSGNRILTANNVRDFLLRLIYFAQTYDTSIDWLLNDYLDIFIICFFGSFTNWNLIFWCDWRELWTIYGMYITSLQTFFFCLNKIPPNPCTKKLLWRILIRFIKKINRKVIDNKT